MALKTSRRTLGAGLLVLAFFVNGSRADLPKVIEAGKCRSAPTIDGVIGKDEWADAPVFGIEMSLIRLDPQATESRHGELRVMNSANALYVAFSIPDSTVDQSLAPLLLDAAILAFGQGDQVKSGDDRKLIAHGIYRDKFVEAPGKGDGDDAHQDGRGAMSREHGVCSFEWAVPLASDDPHDLRAKPGDSLRFNLAYFDGFQIPLTKTKMGGLYGVHLDKSGEWGTLLLAADVKDDGGSAFQSPPWVKALCQKLQGTSPARLRVTGDALMPGASPATAKVLALFTYLDPKGDEKEAKAKLFFPESIKANEAAKLPLFFAAGYELPDGAEQLYTRQGWIVVSPSELSTNPLIRSANPDIALLHLARALPWVDDSRVVIGGGSAGGWMTLLLAAETFPLAGAAPDVPPMNWGYNGAYFFKQLDIAGPAGGSAAKVPAMFDVGTMLKACQDVYGKQYDDSTWFAESPIAQVSTITCPVSVYWSTADVLVPINQIGADWVQAFDASQFPTGFTMDPAKLMESRDGRLRLMDVLAKSDYEIFRLDVPEGTALHNVPGSPGTVKTRELPVSKDKLWSISIIDEGAPVPGIDHRKYDFMPTHGDFLIHVTSGKVAKSQLTPAKLARLMDRYAGKEFLPSRLKHLDHRASERADVLRGLKTYVASSSENRENFANLYGKLAPARQVLEQEVLQSLK